MPYDITAIRGLLTRFSALRDKLTRARDDLCAGREVGNFICMLDAEIRAQDAIDGLREILEDTGHSEDEIEQYLR